METIITLTAELLPKLIDAIVAAVGADTAKALLDDDAVKRANALADYVERLKFGDTPTLSLPAPQPASS
jgi:hypothetical protein